MTNKAKNLADAGKNAEAEKELIEYKEELLQSKFASHLNFVGMIKNLTDYSREKFYAKGIQIIVNVLDIKLFS